LTATSCVVCVVCVVCDVPCVVCRVIVSPSTRRTSCSR
jgi:hypothetical protein